MGEGLKEYLNREAFSQGDSKELVSGLIREVELFSAGEPPGDDMTVVVLSRN